jgi:hypothetical protein
MMNNVSIWGYIVNIREYEKNWKLVLYVILKHYFHNKKWEDVPNLYHCYFFDYQARYHKDKICTSMMAVINWRMLFNKSFCMIYWINMQYVPCYLYNPNDRKNDRTNKQ